MKNLAQREPVVTAAAIAALAGALIGLLVAFGVPVSGDQAEAILQLVGVLAPGISALIGAVVARAHVSPVDGGDAGDHAGD